jgi:hypothetical protein
MLNGIFLLMEFMNDGNNLKISDMKKTITIISILFWSILTYSQEQSYGTLGLCDTCNPISYLGTYEYVGYKGSNPEDRNLGNWKPLGVEDFYYGKTIIFETSRFIWGSGSINPIIIEDPIYTIDKYRLENRGEPYFENSRYWRNQLSYYSSLFDHYEDYTYLISIRDTHINNGGEYTAGDYFLEVRGENLVQSSGDKFYLLKKID